MPVPIENDDPSIDNGDEVWRRIVNLPSLAVFDDNIGRRRPSSGAFEDPKGSSMSVGIASVAAQHARQPVDLIANYPGSGVVGLSVGLLRQLHQGVVRRPLPDSPEHGEVVGTKSHRVRSRMAKESRWLIEPVLQSNS
jgi:hypothetical protein